MVGPRSPCSAVQGRLLGKLRRWSRRWQQLRGGERVAIGLSGGLDSLATVQLLAAHRRTLAGGLELTALHVRLDSEGRSSGLPETTAAWCRELGVGLEEVDPRLDPAEELPLDCHRCAKARRRTLLEAADARGCTHLALGHHADDVVDTWVLSLFYTGTAEVIPPVRSYFGGVVTVVRPLYELRRQEIRRLADRCGFPPLPTPCPGEEHARRDRVRAVLAALGRDEKRVRRQLFWAAMRQLEADAE